MAACSPAWRRGGAAGAHGRQVPAVGAHCTHYHAPLVDGLVGRHAGCSWHHAAFDLASGEALRAPALSPLTRWSTVERTARSSCATRAVLRPGRNRAARRRPGRVGQSLSSVAVAGFAAAEMRAAPAQQGSIVMLSHEDAAPADRPNLSKDYPPATPEEWEKAARPESYYADNGIESRLHAAVGALDPRARSVTSPTAAPCPMTGCRWQPAPSRCGDDPRRRPAPCSRCARSPIAGHHRAGTASRRGAQRFPPWAGSGGLLLYARGIRCMWLFRGAAHGAHPRPQMGDFVRSLHEEHGVVFHSGPRRAHRRGVRDACRWRQAEADLVVAGIGVKARARPGRTGGLAVDRGMW